MRKLVLAIILLSAFTRLFAAHCPSANDFTKRSIFGWGSFWELKSFAAKDWYIDNQYWRSANSSFFPNEASLMTIIDPRSFEVRCIYLLPDRTTMMTISNGDKKVNLRKLDLSLFIPKHQSNDQIPVTKKYWEEDYSITSLSCEGATAANPAHCYWHWK